MSLLNNIYSFYKPVSHFIDNILSFEKTIDSSEAFTRIEQEAIYADGIDRKALWGGFSREFVSSIHPSLEKVLTQFEKEDVENKIALDLGCGKADSTLHLLEKGWSVIAVDYSQEALDNLQEVADRINPDWIQSGQLSLTCHDIENYDFPKNVTLIVANSSLPYLNPLKIRALWDKFYDSLAQGGRIVGDFFPRSVLPVYNIFHRAVMGAWFTDISSVQSLLNHKNYQIEVCEYSNFWFSATRNIEFVGKKQHLPLNKKGLFSIYLSSYYDSVRGLPSKSKFPHFYPFLADRLSELRELSKLSVFANGATALIQTLFQCDASIASYTCIGSISTWFIFKQFAEKVGNKASDHIKKVRSVDYYHSEELDTAMQKINRFQNHEEVQPLFDPPPPKTIEEQILEALQAAGIDIDTLTLVQEQQILEGLQEAGIDIDTLTLVQEQEND